MGEIYRFRTIEHLLGQQYRELEKQTVYFASPEQLSDPMEGLRDIVWRGDEIVWTNLFKHYVYCLHEAWGDAKIAGNEHTLAMGDFSIFCSYDCYKTSQTQDVFDESWRRALTEIGIGNLANKLANVEHNIRVNELLLYLTIVHFRLLQTINETYVDLGYLAESERATVSQLLGPLMLTDSKFFETLPKVRKEDFYQRLSQEGREIFFEILFEIPNGVLADLLLQHNYVRHRGLPDSPSETNNRILIFEFPNIYLAGIEKLLWPQWYTASFTRIYNNSSMWANYANGHKGVCLIFKTEDLGQGPSLPLNETNDDSRASERNGGELWSLSQMIFRPTSYSEKPREVDFFRSIGTLPLQTIMKLWYTNESGDISACASHIKGVLDYGDWHRTYWGTFERDIGIKTKDWHYEEEERLILSSLFNSVLDSRQRTLTYEFNSLAGIILESKRLPRIN